MTFEVDLWDAINRYAIAVGGDPSAHVHGNVPRMQAVADVAKVIEQSRSRRLVDDIVVEELAKGGNAAARRACELKADVERLRMVLTDVRGFLRGVARRPELGSGAQDLIDEAAAITRVLDEKSAAPPKIYVTHVYDAAGHLDDYYVHQTLDEAVLQAATDVVTGCFGSGNPDFYAYEIRRVRAAVDVEPGVGRRHVRCNGWHAHVDERPVCS